MAYNCKFMTEEQLKEIEELMAGEHGKTLVAMSLECCKAGMEMYQRSLIRNSLIAAAGAGLAAGGYWVALRIAKKHVGERLEEAAKKET